MGIILNAITISVGHVTEFDPVGFRNHQEQQSRHKETLKSPCPNQTAHQEDCPHLEGIYQSNCSQSVQWAKEEKQKKMVSL